MPVRAEQRSFDDPARLEAVSSYSDLPIDAASQERFDRITRLAADLIGTADARISLIGQDQLFFRSSAGTVPPAIPRSASFGAWAIASDDPFVVEDATLDERFAQNPFVAGAPFIRFFAGIPLRAPSGQRVGVLCVVDARPRSISARETGQLSALAAIVVDELELSRQSAERSKQTEALARPHIETQNVLDAMKSMFFSVDRQWRMTHVNAAAEAAMGKRREDMLGKPLLEAFPPLAGTAFYPSTSGRCRRARRGAWKATLKRWAGGEKRARSLSTAA